MVDWGYVAGAVTRGAGCMHEVGELTVPFMLCSGE